jgi:hypothetical protein
MKIKQIIIFSLLILSLQSKAQIDYSFQGNVSLIPATSFSKLSDNFQSQNNVNNRLELSIFLNEYITINTHFRNRLISGEIVEQTTNYNELIEFDKGFIDLNKNLSSQKSYILNTQLDRLNINIETDDFVISIGRQRINWGRSLVWNPNDIFNSYSYFDIDYPEKPGSDAVSFLYYLDEASYFDIVASIDYNEKLTTGARVVLNMYEYDFQFMGAFYKEEDLVLGTGFEGNISEFALRAEASYFREIDKFAKDDGTLLFSLESDYNFTNELMVQFEFLYNQLDSETNFNQIMYSNDLSTKKLSFTEYNLFGNISYQLTPLINFSIATIYYPKESGIFISPNLQYSLSDNATFSLFTQSFKGNFIPKEFASNHTYNSIYMNVKLNF